MEISFDVTEHCCVVVSEPVIFLRNLFSDSLNLHLPLTVRTLTTNRQYFMVIVDHLTEFGSTES
jgi:hypothetical protein